MFRRRRPTIQMKTPEQVELMRAAGLLVGRTLELLRGAVKPGITTLDLDALAEEHIRDNGGVPSFKGYHGFTGTICASVNEEIVHGIPRAGKTLRDGDVISIDCGAIVEGWHGDAAITIRSQGRYGIVEGYGGHGIGTEMHMDPLIPNHGEAGHGPVLEPGMCFAVEPMVNLGTKETRELDDGWTVVTTDGRYSAHFEHTFAVTADGPRVLTALDEGRA